MDKVSAKTILQLLNQNWCSTNDLCLIAHCGKNRALTIKRKIKTELDLQGYYLPNNLIPMYKVIEYLKINIGYLKKVSGFDEEK